MKRFTDKLEMTYKSVRIRNIQRVLNILQVVLIIIICVILLIYGGASLNPFFFPMDYILLFLIFMLIIFSVEAIVFRLLEIRYSKSDSAVYLMARNSLKRAGVFLAVSLLVIAVPVLLTLTTGGLSKTDYGIQVSGTSPFNQTFENRDRFAFTNVTGIQVSASGDSVCVHILSEQDFKNSNFGGCSAIVQDETERIFYNPGSGYRAQVLYMTSSGSSLVTYTIEVKPSPFVVSYVLLVAVISLVIQSIWIMYLYPVMKKYSSLSIYSGEYVYTSDESYQRPVLQRSGRPRFEVAGGRGGPGHPRVPMEIQRAPGGASVEGLLAEARSHLNAGNYEMALAGFDRVLGIEPKNIMALVNKCKILEGLDRKEQALVCYDTILALNPSTEMNWVKSGDLLKAMGNATEAGVRYRKALTLNPSSAAKGKLALLEGDIEFLISQALLLSGMGKFEESLRYYDMVVEKEPENLKALIGKSVVLRNMRRFDDAIDILKGILSIDLHNTTALEGLVECYDEIIKLNPRDEGARLDRGDILVELGQNDKALEDFKLALKVNPSNEEARIRIEDLEMTETAVIDGSESTIQEFTKIPGIGRARARALIEAGYKNNDDLAKATKSELIKVKGINYRLAEIIHLNVGAQT